MCSKNNQGFKEIPLRFSANSTSSHTLFVKEHSVRNFDDDKPPGKTLFVLNIPPYTTEESLKKIFSESGKVNSVKIQSSINSDEVKTDNGFKVGYVVYHKRDGLLKCLNSNDTKTLSNKEHPVKVGLKKWISKYNSSICDPSKLTEEVNLFMANFDKKENEKKTEQTNIDDEGWTVVTKKGRNPGVSRKECVELKLREKIKQKSDKKELKNFYTFQIRESKMKNIANLRKNFEEAKMKVNAMKSARRFRPY